MRLILIGDGRMAHAVAEQAKASGHEILATLGRDTLEALTVDALADQLGEADIAIDFTVADQVTRSVAAAARAGIGLILSLIHI